MNRPDKWGEVFYRWLSRQSSVSKRMRRRKVRQCAGKFAHLDFLSAMRHAEQLEGQWVNIYMCDVCGLLHVGRGIRHGQYMFEQEFRFEW